MPYVPQGTSIGQLRTISKRHFKSTWYPQENKNSSLKDCLMPFGTIVNLNLDKNNLLFALNPSKAVLTTVGRKLIATLSLILINSVPTKSRETLI
tara:strand:- start:2900 stop:3184 length:285 start_codon:yes stop_codon:yes gene_type:complete